MREEQRPRMKGEVLAETSTEGALNSMTNLKRNACEAWEAIKEFYLG